MQMELRYNEVERARGIYERYIRCLPEVKSWVRYAKFEMKAGDVPRARGVYERAVQELEGEAHMVRGIAASEKYSTDPLPSYGPLRAVLRRKKLLPDGVV